VWLRLASRKGGSNKVLSIKVLKRKWSARARLITRLKERSLRLKGRRCAKKRRLVGGGIFSTEKAEVEIPLNDRKNNNKVLKNVSIGIAYVHEVRGGGPRPEASTSD